MCVCLRCVCVCGSKCVCVHASVYESWRGPGVAGGHTSLGLAGLPSDLILLLEHLHVRHVMHVAGCSWSLCMCELMCRCSAVLQIRVWHKLSERATALTCTAYSACLFSGMASTDSHSAVSLGVLVCMCLSGSWTEDARVCVYLLYLCVGVCSQRRRLGSGHTD